MKKVILSWVIAICSYGSLPAEEISKEVQAKEFIEYTNKKMPSCGILKIAQDGTLYLKLPDTYAKQLIPHLKLAMPEDEALFLMTVPEYDKDIYGTHIKVIDPSEMTGSYQARDQGRKACFKVTGLYYFDPEKGPAERVYYLTVKSKDLQKIRKSYGLSSLYHDEEFRMIIGVINRPDWEEDYFW